MGIDPITTGLELGTELLKLVNKVLDFFPDYENKKIELYHYHAERYAEELTKDYKFRDDNRIDYHRDQMALVAQDFAKFIDQKKAAVK